MELDAVVLLLVALAALASVFFTVVPLLPGTLFVLVGMVAVGLVSGWETFPWWAWIIQVALAAVYIVVDQVVQAVGIGRAGGSRAAMAGGTMGVFVGPLVLAPVLGPFALFVGPPVGAVVGTVLGELRVRRRTGDSATTRGDHARLGWAALVAYVLGLCAKLGVLVVQLVIFVLLAL